MRHVASTYFSVVPRRSLLPVQVSSQLPTHSLLLLLLLFAEREKNYTIRNNFETDNRQPTTNITKQKESKKSSTVASIICDCLNEPVHFPF